MDIVVPLPVVLALVVGLLGIILIMSSSSKSGNDSKLKKGAGEMLKVYYWPMLARGAPLVRMLEYTGTAYEYISDPAEFAKVMSRWGAKSDVFAPPVVVDGDTVISQSTASAMYLGQRLGLIPAGFDQFKAFQYLSDIIDVFEQNLGKNNEQGPALKKFLEGDRWPLLMRNLEAGIKGPYYFGDEPCCVDFFLAAHLDWRSVTLFNPLKAKHGVDALKPFPKVSGVYNALKATNSWGDSPKGLRHMKPISDEILSAYHD